MIRKLEDSDERRIQREDDARKEQLASQEKVQQAMDHINMMKMEQTERMENNRIDAEIYEKELDIQVQYAKLDQEQGLGSMTPDEVAKRKHELDMLKLQLSQRREDMKMKSEMFYDQLKEKRNIVDKQLRSSEKIARSRPKPKSIKN
jgi:hypothetical protein